MIFHLSVTATYYWKCGARTEDFSLEKEWNWKVMLVF